jgi:hypothetical protein
MLKSSSRFFDLLPLQLIVMTGGDLLAAKVKEVVEIASIR